ncbi:MAG: hypothetical protein QOG54_849 [Actinomycetota bacterium]|jgi:uncharacterized membrane protein YczE|nr:hypothetical protein [Actinomycetota bacterium]
MSLILPVPSDRRPRRIVQLYSGLVLYGFSSGLLVLARLGLDPWDAFHQGLARHTGLTIGTITIIISGVVLLLWIPLRQRPGIGTLSNAILIGLMIDLTINLVGYPQTLVLRCLALGAGVGLNGIATGLYIGAGMGPGPRDGLMTGLAARGRSIRVVRTAIEITVLALGWTLGGTVGIGTLIYALSIGPIAHVTIPLFTVGRTDPASPPDAHPSVS